LSRRKQKAAARVAQEIVQTIYDEKLKPGDHYLSEVDAIARHGVSRAVFREALRFLEFQGVLRVRVGPGGGAVVQRPDWHYLTSTFALLLQFADATRAEVMAARTVLEPHMAALAAINATPEVIDTLSRQLAEARRQMDDRHRFSEAYRLFWATIASATNSAVMALLWPALRALVDSGGFVPNEKYRAVLTERMDLLVRALVARDAEGASRLVAQLDREFNERLTDLYPKRISRRIAWTDVLGDAEDRN
jgi:GntR family transcriptional regulator, transcriptional repressor for pyruvate dehydrogenase complex